MMKPGVELLEDAPGLGPLVEKKVFYDFRFRMWLSHGDPIRWTKLWGLTIAVESRMTGPRCSHV